MKCPYCEKECKPSTERTVAAMGGRAMRSDGKYQHVWRCKAHGVMRIANVYSDAYMGKAYPDLHLVMGQWIPRNRPLHWEDDPRPREVVLYRTNKICANVGPCEDENCRICWTETCPW